MYNLLLVLPDDPIVIWKAIGIGVLLVFIGLIGMFFTRGKHK